MEKIILTGDRPTGRLHLGHYVGSLKRRVELQNSGQYDKVFIMIAVPRPSPTMRTIRKKSGKISLRLPWTTCPAAWTRPSPPCSFNPRSLS